MTRRNSINTLSSFNIYIYNQTIIKQMLLMQNRTTMSTKTRLNMLVMGYMTKEFSVRKKNYQNELNLIIKQLLGNIFIKLANNALTIMINNNDTQLVNNSLWAFDYLSQITTKDDNEYKIKPINIINTQSINQLTQLLDHNIHHIQEKALQTVITIIRYKNTNDTTKKDVLQTVKMLQRVSQNLTTYDLDDPTTQFQYTTQIRFILSIQHNPPIGFVVDSGLVPTLIPFLQSPNHRLQFEAAWALTNICNDQNPESTNTVIRYGAVPIFIQLLQSPHYNLKEQSIWALGNIASEPHGRDIVLSHGALIKMLSIFQNQNHSNYSHQLPMHRTAAWALSNFCRGEPAPAWTHIQLQLKCITILINSVDDEILHDVLWALNYLSESYVDSDSKITEAIVNSCLLKRLIVLLEHSNDRVQNAAIRTIGDILAGPDKYTKKVIDSGFLSKLAKLIKEGTDKIRREACWALSNITAGSNEQIKAVFEANLFLILITVMDCDEYNVAKQAVWAISNATNEASDAQIQVLVNQGVIKACCKFWGKTQASNVILVALEMIDNILIVGDRMRIRNKDGCNSFAQCVVECGGDIYLRQLLMKNMPDEVYDKATLIIKKYFTNGETMFV
eukprot:284203_1